MNKKYSEDEDTLIVEEIQSLLQEKRPALKTIRLGIAVIVAQISLIGFLFATFRSHATIQAQDWMGILAALGVILLGVVIYFFYHSTHPHLSHGPEDIEIQTKTQ